MRRLILLCSGWNQGPRLRRDPLLPPAAPRAARRNSRCWQGKFDVPDPALAEQQTILLESLARLLADFLSLEVLLEANMASSHNSHLGTGHDPKPCLWQAAATSDGGSGFYPRKKKRFPKYPVRSGGNFFGISIDVRSLLCIGKHDLESALGLAGVGNILENL